MESVNIADTLNFSYIFPTWDFLLWKADVVRNVVIMIMQGLRQEVIHSESLGLVNKGVTNTVQGEAAVVHWMEMYIRPYYINHLLSTIN